MELASLHFFFPIILFLLPLLSISSVAHTMDLPKGPVEKLIRAMNLFPELDANVAENDHTSNGPLMVEKCFLFPGFTNPPARGERGPDSGHRSTGPRPRGRDSGHNGSNVQDSGHKTGYYGLPHRNGARMFYFFFESRNKLSTDPVIVWLSGGPGCSSSLALFYENGPFHIADNLSLVWNDFGWDKVSNLIYVDQPVGTGFSYTSNTDDIPRTSKQAAVDFYAFLQEFFKAHPQYVKNDFYITGESYAGHYIPAFADRVLQGNNNKEGIHINLKGIAIGNGLTDPEIQYKAYPDYALTMNLIGPSDYNDLNQSVTNCISQIELCGKSGDQSTNCEWASLRCNSMFNNIVDLAGEDLNVYDIRKPCVGSLCYNFSNMESFLNKDLVRQALGVGGIKFVSCSSVVYSKMTLDWMRNYEVVVPTLLKNGIKTLIYAGEYDLICNWLGNSRWVDAMVWPGRERFVSSRFVPFKVDGEEAGLRKSYGLLTFLKVYNAGHMVPMDQPKAALEMLTRWLRGKPL